MIIGVLQNTPRWVWAVLLGLVVLGLLQTRTRRVNRLLVLLLPAIMIPLSLYAVMASFGVSVAAFSAHGQLVLRWRSRSMDSCS
jgi:hypothetical protein